MGQPLDSLGMDRAAPVHPTPRMWTKMNKLHPSELPCRKNPHTHRTSYAFLNLVCFIPHIRSTFSLSHSLSLSINLSIYLFLYLSMYVEVWVGAIVVLSPFRWGLGTVAPSSNPQFRQHNPCDITQNSRPLPSLHFSVFLV